MIVFKFLLSLKTDDHSLDIFLFFCKFSYALKKDLIQYTCVTRFKTASFSIITSFWFQNVSLRSWSANSVTQGNSIKRRTYSRK